MLLTPPVLHLLGRQHGIASDAQLGEHLTTRQIRRALAHGLLHGELPGVRRLAGTVEDVQSRVMALSLYSAPDGFISGMAAARQHGVECVPREYLELMVHERRAPHLPKWVTCTRSSWRLEADRRELSGGRAVASPLRTLFRCGATCSEVRFEKIAEQMWNRKLITPSEAADYLELVRRQGRYGVGRFEKWLEKASTRERPSQSASEVELALAAVAAGLPEPVRQHQLTLLNGEPIHVDVAWPVVRLGLEPGATFWHSGDEKVRSDHGRDRACDEIGWRIVRFDEVELRDLDSCVRQVVNIYRQRMRSLVVAS